MQEWEIKSNGPVTYRQTSHSTLYYRLIQLDDSSQGVEDNIQAKIADKDVDLLTLEDTPAEAGTTAAGSTLQLLNIGPSTEEIGQYIQN